MQVKLEKTYPLPVNVDAAWRLLSDIPQMAACMPGAEITAQVDETHYKGSVKIKLGPASAAFAGDIEVLAVDPAARMVRLKGKGADRGGSNASMDLTATVQATADGNSELVGSSEVTVNGKFAQFGGRMMNQVSEMILAQFVQNFAATASAMPAAEAPIVEASPADAPVALATRSAVDEADAQQVASQQDASQEVAAQSANALATAGAAPAALPAEASTGDVADASPRALPASVEDVAARERAADLAASAIAQAAARTAAASTAAVAPAASSPAVAPAASSPAAAPAAPRPAPTPLARPAMPVKELNGLAIAWALVRGWVARLFGRG